MENSANPAKVVTGAIAGTSAKSLREELAWEELSIRRKIHKLSHFYKIVNKSTAPYLVDLLPILVNERSYISLRTGQNISEYISEYIDVELKNSKSFFLPRFLYGTLLILM